MLASCCLLNSFPFRDQDSDNRIAGSLVVTGKSASCTFVMKLLENIGYSFLSRTFPVLSGLCTLTLHAKLESRFIDAHPLGRHDVCGEIDRKPEGIVEPEYRIAAEDGLAAAFHAGDIFVQNGKPSVECLCKALLFSQDHFLDILLALYEFRKCLSHDEIDRIDSPM